MNRTICVMISVVLFSLSCSREKRLLRKAAIEVDRAEYEKAVSHYDQILQKNKDSYFGNAGKGIVLSEYLEKHNEAIPYLENALKKSPGKTKMKINYDLGKSYQFIGNYPRALYYYERAIPYNNSNNPDYDVFLSKRIADCRYAMEHPEVAPPTQQWVKNIGKPVNTPMPEYSPVFLNNKMIFTSRRQDSKKEKRNGVDGKYFEKMYVCNVSDTGFTEPVKYSLPDYSKNLRYNRHNESILSVSNGNNKLFVYRDGKIYESDIIDSNATTAKKMSDEINFSYLQSHASLSSDGKTIFFSSESDNGRGGTDIYRSIKSDAGDWLKPELLSVNTEFNEDAPFIDETGVLFFSSNGLPGYGGYDVYRTKLVNGEWTRPENLGQPVNSPADDIYFALKQESSMGYYASGRLGGEGDMDIYQVYYVSTRIKDCERVNDLFTIKSEADSSNNLVYSFGIETPKEYNQKIKSYSWLLNNQSLNITESEFKYEFKSPGTYTVFSKVIVLCDTCTALASVCAQTTVNVGEIPIVISEQMQYETKEDTLNRSQDKAMVKTNGFYYYNEKELKELGWNSSPIYFDERGIELDDDAKNILEKNSVILQANRNIKIEIVGYSDSRGDAVFNKNLSYKRANAVKQYFLANKVNPAAIVRTQGLGETNFVNNCDDNHECSEEEHAENRRVVVKVKKVAEKPIVTND